MVSYRIYLAE